MRRANVFSLTLKSHDSNLNEIVDALSNLRRFDKEIWLDLSQFIRICAFTLCFLKNMSQQQINANFKSQNAIKNCRFCTIDAHVKNNLNFDIIKQNRFHNVTIAQKQKMTSLSIKIKREKFAFDLELSVEQSSLFNIFFALNIITTRLSDSAHSEYENICKMFHTFFLEIILIIANAKFYVIAIRNWFFSSNFEHLHSSLHHFKNYSLSKHARWIVIVSELLRCWIQKRNIQSHYFDATRAHCRSYFLFFIATEFIIKIYVFVVKFTNLLMSNNLIERNFFMQQIKNAKIHVQQLLDIAIFVANTNSKSRSTISTRKKSMKLVLSSIERIQSSMRNEKLFQKITKFANDKIRLNIHTTLHYEISMNEYEMSSNVNVLINENKHKWRFPIETWFNIDDSIVIRWFKNVVYQINHNKIEKFLFAHENLRQNVRFILLNAFPKNSEIINLMKNFYRKCFTLFQTFFLATKRKSLRDSFEKQKDENDWIVQSNKTHDHVIVTECLTIKYCNEIMLIFTRSSDINLMIFDFKFQLKTTLAKNYDIFNVMHFDYLWLQWCKKLIFATK